MPMPEAHFCFPFDTMNSPCSKPTSPAEPQILNSSAWRRRDALLTKCESHCPTAATETASRCQLSVAQNWLPPSHLDRFHTQKTSFE